MNGSNTSEKNSFKENYLRHNETIYIDHIRESLKEGIK